MQDLIFFFLFAVRIHICRQFKTTAIQLFYSTQLLNNECNDGRYGDLRRNHSRELQGLINVPYERQFEKVHILFER